MIEQKLCNKCGEIKDSNQFYKHGNGRRPRCKECESPGKAAYYKSNREDILEYRRGYYQEHRDRCLDYNKNYIEDNRIELYENNKIYAVENKDRINSYKNQYQKARRMVDPGYRLRASVSSMINLMLKSEDSSKFGSSVLQYLPYSFQQLKEHFEKQFKPWMSWDNYGRYVSQTWDDNNSLTWTWQIDHIIPQSDLPYASMEDENFKKCWSLENLRPLSSKQNVLDGSNRIRHGQDGE